MKKFISAICLVLFACNTALAVAERPNFSDICPAEYYHKKTLTKDEVVMKNIIPVPIVVFGYLDFVLPGVVMNVANVKHKTKVLNRYNTAVEYWQNRENDFNQSVDKCSASAAPSSCYQQVVAHEKELNTVLNNKLNGKDVSLKYNKKGKLVLKN